MIVRGLAAMRSGWIVLGFLVTIFALAPDGLRMPVLVFGAYYSYTRFFVVFHDWISLRYAADGSGVRISKGVVGRQDKLLPWRSVSSVSQSQSLVQRLLRVTDVRISVNASDGAGEAIPSISEREAARIQRLHHRASRSAPGESPLRRNPHSVQVKTGADAHSVISPVLRGWDFVLIGIASGAFLWFIPSLYSLVAEVASFIGSVRGILPTVDDLRGVGGWRLTVILSACAACSIAYGSLFAWLKYRRFVVALGTSGELVFRAGLTQREHRVVAANAVSAYELRQPLLLLPLRRASLRAMIRGDGGQITEGRLLPLTSASNGLRMLNALTDVDPARFSSPARPQRAWLMVGSSAGVIAGLTVASWVGVGPGPALALTAAYLLIWRFTDSRFGRIDVATNQRGARWLVARRGVAFRSVWLIPEEAIDFSRWSGAFRHAGFQVFNLRGRHVVRLTVWPVDVRTSLRLRRMIGCPRSSTTERAGT
ncbi:PH domain-containing protein [Curtobacterium sp. VKM Ac-1393]|uniref:PH domain-containing protein n=1 Tax=Curtobacterium sp. VKM Ac-1393 TaxID=2783814 RepID=UPI001889D903|nr:PH domain-containing protein [Curtobacterium sp. VKM Ac-1393]MBF4606605.1 PH domain-containing protein [Curtobacterium sp. VKM Ac-1393]